MANASPGVVAIAAAMISDFNVIGASLIFRKASTVTRNR